MHLPILTLTLLPLTLTLATSTRPLRWPTNTVHYSDIATKTRPQETHGGVTHAPLPDPQIPPSISHAIKVSPGLTSKIEISLVSAAKAEMTSAGKAEASSSKSGRSGHKAKRDANADPAVARAAAAAAGSPTTALNKPLSSVIGGVPPLRAGRFPPVYPASELKRRHEPLEVVEDRGESMESIEEREGRKLMGEGPGPRVKLPLDSGVGRKNKRGQGRWFRREI
ncbi:MAG: hypothetical protein M1828_000604 [Chrysothrix sp. TS-e1954]|nr:MAG: hypothetical protein M1828_000604 [Chrysothrix sp. TS-e1954]